MKLLFFIFFCVRINWKLLKLKRKIDLKITRKSKILLERFKDIQRNSRDRHKRLFDH